jgi:hypothetical protein
MTLFISILVVLSTWFLIQRGFVLLRKQRRVGFTKLSQTPIREVVDNLALIVTASARHLNMAPNQPTHTHARLVITEHWLVLASDKGVLLREDRNGRLKLKDLGKGRWMLLGTTPNSEASLRIVLLPGKEDDWVESLRHFCG